MTDTTFNPEEFWKDKTVKKWVVTVASNSEKEKRYISAKTKSTAIETASIITNLRGLLNVSARLATPKDLEARLIDKGTL